MGVPVTGKKTIFLRISRACRRGMRSGVTRDAYAARASQVDIMVAMNAEKHIRGTFRELSSGGYLIYDSTLAAQLAPAARRTSP